MLIKKKLKYFFKIMWIKNFIEEGCTIKNVCNIVKVCSTKTSLENVNQLQVV